MGRPVDTSLKPRNRMIVAAAKEGHPYKTLAETYGLSPSRVAQICIRAGHKRWPEWSDERKAAFREVLKIKRKKKK